MNGQVQSNKNILIVGAIREIQSRIDELKGQGWNTIVVPPAANREEMIQSLHSHTKDVTIIMLLLPWTLGRLNAEVLEHFTPALKLVSGLGAGESPRIP